MFIRHRQKLQVLQCSRGTCNGRVGRTLLSDAFDLAFDVDFDLDSPCITASWNENTNTIANCRTIKRQDDRYS
jgi:hypothetical protein